jgi:hypothetical protein
LYRIDATRAPRRQPRGDERHDEQERRHRHERRRVVNAHLVHPGAQHADGGDRQDASDRDPDERKPQALTQHHPAHASGIRADGDADADLARALGDQVREHAVETDDRERRGEKREHAEQDQRVLARRHGLGEGALDSGEHRLRLRGVELAHGAANRRLNPLRLIRRAHDQMHRRIVAGKLPAMLGERRVHDRQVALVLRWRPGDVFDHADDELWIAPVAHVAAERRIAFQVDANVGLGDDGNALRSISVVSIEEPALDQLGANGLEVVRAGVDDTVARNLLPFIANLAEDHDVCALRAAGRRRVGVRDRLHTGLPAHALDDGLGKLHRLFVRVALRLRRTDPGLRHT